MPYHLSVFQPTIFVGGGGGIDFIILQGGGLNFLQLSHITPLNSSSEFKTGLH